MTLPAADQSWPQPDVDEALEDEDSVGRWLDTLVGDRLAVDLEADGMFRYRARLCTVQLADVDSMVVVDTLAVPPRRALADILGDPAVQKVIHDVSFDARMLSQADVPLVNVFDTSVAVRYLAYQGTGLAAIVDRHFGVELQKEQQQADWGKRPLGPRAMNYLYADVRYLLALADALDEELRHAGIFDEFGVECRYVVAQALAAEEDTRSAWMRIKGSVKLPPVERAVLREVAQVREEIARETDVPAGRLIPTGILQAMAERRPKNESQVAKLLRRGKFGDHEHGRFVDAVERGIDAGDAPESELRILKPPAPPSAERNRLKKLRSALTAYRTEQSEARGVDAQVVLPGHCLKDLMALEEPTRQAIEQLDGFGECRIERYADALLKILRAEY